MRRDDWNAVYRNQDRILHAFKSLEDEIILAGGTGLQRFILPCAYRHFEDLDDFFPRLRSSKQVCDISERMVKLIQDIPGTTIEDARRDKDENAFRLWCRFEDNDEVIKVELLNFTCTRLKDTRFIPLPFKTENLYNIQLYKLKALCEGIIDLKTIRKNFSDSAIAFYLLCIRNHPKSIVNPAAEKVDRKQKELQ